ncbi:thermonuclease family protein [Paramagnetospirillum kuznetsovii]|uniref:thermonuclease family protein n=1 Tax=Paramagnetospirillum kuznetsovii TaxID=2053833 RepID=UPI001EFEEB80|nr:nuclease [Paramagnetospirillum kuznetsovii]
MHRIILLPIVILAWIASAQAAPLRCPEDVEGGACVWGKVEGFDGGAVQIRGLHIALAGVVVPTRKDLCASRAAKEEFDCARPARKRMAELVAKGVACEILDVASGQLWGRCRTPDGDIGRLLVQSGVARAAKDGPYADSQKQAVQGKKGLWAADMVLPKDWETARRKAEDED